MKPLEGIRVLEVAMYGFVPSAGAVLAEWGADVIKVEHAVTGDPQRGLRQTGPLRVEGDPNPNVEHANRGKRSIGLDMSVPEGKEVLLELARRADVFLTSFLPGHRKKFGIDVDDIRAVNPKIIYARGSALGPRGEESVKGGYDMTAFWCRAGTAATITPPGIDGMIGAAGSGVRRHHLRHEPRRRDRGGAAQARAHRRTVDRRRLAAGQRPVVDGAHGRADQAPRPADGEPPPGVHGSPINPLVGVYPTADGRYISFVMMQPTKFWADVCRHMDLDDFIDDPRFATVESIAENTAAAVEILTRSDGQAADRRVERTVRHPCRAVGAGAGHLAGRRGRIRCGPTSIWCRRANSNWWPTRCSSTWRRRRPGPAPGSPSRPTRSCMNWAGLGPHHRAQDRRRGHVGRGRPMPYVASIGTYLPCWGTSNHRVAGDDEDAITLAVEAGRAALAGSAAAERVVLVSRDLPLTESSNAAVLLAGLSLDPELEVDERLGGAPAARRRAQFRASAHAGDRRRPGSRRCGGGADR